MIWRKPRLPQHGSETLPRTMPQLLLPGMPEGAIRSNPVVSRLSKDRQVTWFLDELTTTNSRNRPPLHLSARLTHPLSQT